MSRTETPYERIGGEAGVRALVRRFYELMDTLPEAYGIRKLHQPDLSSAEEDRKSTRLNSSHRL